MRSRSIFINGMTRAVQEECVDVRSTVDLQAAESRNTQVNYTTTMYICIVGVTVGDLTIPPFL